LPPLKGHKKPLRECQHQKPANGGRDAGVLEGKTEGEPTLTHVMPEDLRDTARLLVLFDEAQRQGLIGGSESERLTFVATAERARVRALENAEGLFAELVRRRLWHFVTQDDEGRAHARLRKHFYGGRDEGRTLATKIPSEVLSKDALFVADVTAKLRRKGFLGDVFLAVSPHLPDWTRERWERAAQELEDHRRRRSEEGLSRVGDFGVSADHVHG
jgi:hypothetical protein